MMYSSWYECPVRRNPLACDDAAVLAAARGTSTAVRQPVQHTHADTAG
jgi:hypothetical protein